MNFLPILSMLLVIAYAKELIDFQEIIDEVNSGPSKWKAGHNFGRFMPLSVMQRMLGALPSTKNLPLRERHSIPDSEIPKEFDSRKQWPYCPTISSISDQSNCGSCWAVSTAGTFSDRYCIATNGNFTLPLSAEELMSCCDDCGSGCDGGSTIIAWEYIRDHGIVTGGEYHSNVGCQPYIYPPCIHLRSLKKCRFYPKRSTPKCERNCTNPGYKQSFKSDLRRTKNAYSLEQDESEIMKEIMLHGPVVAGLTVYADFGTYKTGVYRHQTGKCVGEHAVRVIGWGVEDETPYWLIANSWNERWGDKGLIKILRGKNECGIEEEVVAGVPDV